MTCVICGSAVPVTEPHFVNVVTLVHPDGDRSVDIAAACVACVVVARSTRAWSSGADAIIAAADVLVSRAPDTISAGTRRGHLRVVPCPTTT